MNQTVLKRTLSDRIVREPKRLTRALLLAACLLGLGGPILDGQSQAATSRLHVLPPIHRPPIGDSGVVVLPPSTHEIPPEPSPAVAQSLTILGGVIVDIEPVEAVADGAVWTLDNGPEHPTRFEEQEVSAGVHTVRFPDLPRWREPGPLEVLVIGGKPALASVRFAPIPTFDFREVPEQTARHGETLEFFLDPKIPVQVSAAPPPAGSIDFDAATGHFQYTPAPADRLPFTLTFTTTDGLTASTTVSPLPDLPDEQIVLNYERPLPDEESRDYMTITEVENPAEVFNDAERETLTIQISGKTLVFDEDHPAQLLRQFNERENIKKLELFADRIIIRAPLILPQTDVVIHARELRFEGDGSINTTPLPRRLKPSGAVFEDDLVRGIDGDPGHQGGDVDVFVERFHSDATQSVRFILHGGDGGPAGEGRDGKPDNAFSIDSANWRKLMARAGNHICEVRDNKGILYTEDRFPNTPPMVCGAKVTARGESAVPSGRPGAGGTGGTLRSTIDLTSFADLSGGVPGAKGGDYTGAGLVREFAYRVTSTIFKPTGPIESTGFTRAPRVRGNDAPAPSATKPAGESGTMEVVSNPSVWLHSFIVRSVVQFAKDAYLNGREDEARSLLAEYRDLLLALQPEVPADSEMSDEVFAESTNLDQLLVEMESIIHRVDSNLDFFGNPAGWVPMLSFEANLLAFENEVDRSIPILYLAHWLRHAATNHLNSLSAAETAREQLQLELNSLVASFNEAQTAIPRLQVEADAIRLRIGALRGQLAALEAELEERARQNVEDRHKLPFWKKALGTLSVASHLVPVGQPIVGQIGSGLELLTQFDVDKPLESAATITPKAFEIFSQTNITFCFESSSTNNPPAGTNSTNTVSAKKEKLKRLSECGKFLGTELQELAGLFKDVQIDKTELQAELEKLKASDFVFNQVTRELEELNKEKERLAQELAAAIQAITSLTSAMTQNILATHDMEQQIEDALAALDHNALLHISEMERRAKDRLLKFHYFAAKAFQYRTLQPYSGNLQLDRLFERFQVLVSDGNSHLLSAEEFQHLKSLYLAELRDIVGLAFDILNSNAPERSLPITFRLNEEELARLNEEGRVLINLQKRGLFPSNHENIRIADLRTHSLLVHPDGGQIGTHALLFLDFEHLGVSRLSSDGQTFLFRHYQTEAVNPITWGTVFDGVAGSFTNSVLSPAIQSLLHILLNQPTTENLLLFSRPAAAADILLTREVLTDNGANLVVDDIQIEVRYEFYRTSSSQPELQVLVSDDLEPLITVSRPDLNGRQDGQGDFRRIYPAGSVVTLQAPQKFGELNFDRWIINAQERPAGETSVTLALALSTRAEARYAAPASPEDPGSESDSTADSDPAAEPDPGLLSRDLIQAQERGRGLTARLVQASTSRGLLTSGSTSPAPSAQVLFTFPTTAGVRYRIESASDLANPDWVSVEQVLGTGETMTFTRPAESPAAYFRVVAEKHSVRK